MSSSKGTFAGWLGRGLLAALAVGALTATGTTLAFKSHAGRSSQTHTQKARIANPRSAFGVLARGHARTASTSGAMFPADAALATVVGNREVYVWEVPGGEDIAPFSRRHAASTTEVCIGWEEAGGGGTGSCGPASAAAEHGSVTVGRVRNQSTGALSARIVTILVPNGVQDVTLTDRDGATRNVKVTNNVVIEEGESLASPPAAAAVTYRLPTGRTETAPMPASPAEP